MDKPNSFNDTRVPIGNTLNYEPGMYSANEKATLTQVDSRTHLHAQQPQPYPHQQHLSSYLRNQPQNSSHLYPQNHLLQTGAEDTLANGLNKAIQAAGTQRYPNKYSFKRNQTAKQFYTPQPNTYVLDKTNTNHSNEIKEQKINNTTIIIQREQTTSIHITKIKQLEVRIKEQQLLLAKIRETAYNRKVQCQRNADKDYACLSTLVQIYNLTIINTQLTPLPNIIVTTRPISANTGNISTNYIPAPINIKIPPSPVRPPIPTYPPIYIPPKPIIRPIQPHPVRPQPPTIIFPPQPQPQPKPQPQPQPQPIVIPQPKPIIINPPPITVPPSIPVPPTKDVEIIDKSQQYIKQIKELRIKIQQLESQRIRYIEQVKYYERFESTSHQTILVYKEQIQRLKEKIIQLTIKIQQPVVPSYPSNDKQIQELKQKISVYISRQKQYEYQLIQAQNHIIYLQNSRKPSATCQHQHYELEIKTLRQTIARYTQHIETIEHQKEQYHKYILQKDQEITRLYSENNSLNIYIEQTKSNTAPTGIDPNEYYSLLTEYGKKDLQVVILLSQIERLREVNLEIRGYLEKAEVYIAQIHQQQTSGSGTSNDSYKQLEIALEKEYQNQAVLKKTYQVEVQRLTIVINQLSKQIQLYETTIATYKHDYQTTQINVTQLNQKLALYQLEINNYKLQIQRITHLNLQLTQQITIFKTEITNLTTQISTITSHTTTIQGIDEEIYNAAILDLGKKQLQVIILLEEINRLNFLRIDLMKHLQQAENYIFGAQQYIKQLENKTSTPSVNNLEIQGYKSKIKDLQANIILINQKISIYVSKEATYLKQIQELELKYNTFVVQSDKKYQQLLIQRNSLSSKITVLTQRSTVSSSLSILIQKSMQLHKINKQLNIQIAQITQQLLKAQTYIQTNSQKWQQFDVVQIQLTQKVQLIELLNKEIQLTKTQNIQLNDRIIEFETLITQFYSNATTQITTVVTSEQQHFQTSTNANQTLHTSAQSKLQINQGQGQWRNLQLENGNMQKRLLVAEEQKKELTLQFQKLHADYIRILEQNEREINEKNAILEALTKAEQYIRAITPNQS